MISEQRVELAPQLHLGPALHEQLRRESACVNREGVCVCERERERQSVCVREREREKERQSVCV